MGDQQRKASAISKQKLVLMIGQLRGVLFALKGDSRVDVEAVIDQIDWVLEESTITNDLVMTSLKCGKNSPQLRVGVKDGELAFGIGPIRCARTVLEALANFVFLNFGEFDVNETMLETIQEYITDKTQEMVLEGNLVSSSAVKGWCFSAEYQRKLVQDGLLPGRENTDTGFFLESGA